MDKLGEYIKKRDFEKTPEPGDNKRNDTRGPIFVIQKHSASNLHYDFRLEMNGVLKSWAIPKGPSLNPSEKRLAIETEDHPLGYANFEGTIPEKEYGGGTVLVWDKGVFKNLKDKMSLEESYKKGQIEVWLEGEKLEGGYVLVKTGREDHWLLIKMKDDKADRRRNPVSTEPK